MSKELDYITELERKNRLLGERCNQILKDKGELIDKVKELQDHLAEEVELHLHAEEYIKSLEKENEQLRNNGFTVSAMTEQQLKVAIEKGEQLEKENAELKADNRLLEQRGSDILKELLDKNKRCKELERQIEKMKNDLREVKNNYDKSKDKTPISMFGAEYRLFCDIENLLDKWE